MTSLVEVLKKDLQSVGALSLGLARGIYTPFLLATGIRQLNLAYIGVSNGNSRNDTKRLGQAVGFAFGIYLLHIPLIVHSIQQQRGKEYLGILAATNLMDYLIEVYRRAKQENS